MKKKVFCLGIILMVFSISLLFVHFNQKFQNDSTEILESIDDNNKDSNEEDNILENTNKVVEDNKNINQISDENNHKEEIKKDDIQTNTAPNPGIEKQEVVTENQIVDNNGSEKEEPVQSDQNSQTKTELTKKVWSDEEITSYAQKVIQDFRLDFKTISECENEGKNWSDYGWGYRCMYISIPETDIIATMLVLFTKDIFCDNDWTGSHNYYYKDKKIGNVAYLRELGYKCENIQGDIY